MKDRLASFLAYLDISQRKFEANCGLSNGFADKVGDSIRTNNLNKISNIYPELNTNWLKTGEGEMLKPQHNKVQDSKIQNSTVQQGNNITNNDLTAIKELMSPIFSLMEKKDEQILEVLKIIDVLKSKDEQINKLIAMVERLK